jgi:hypothetical protein
MFSKVNRIESHQTRLPCVEGYLEGNNEWIIEWNARAREMHEQEIRRRAVVAKQGVLEDFWFKP